MHQFFRDNSKPQLPNRFSLVAEKGRESILVVDDEPGYRASLDHILSAEGYVVELAAGGLEALHKMKIAEYDLILLDLMMPGFNGHQVLGYIDANNQDSSVLVLSGTTSVSEATDALREGAHDYLRKPFDPQDLLHAVENLCKNRRLERAARGLQAQLQESEQLHRFIVNNSPDLIFILDADFRFIYFNQRLILLLGCTDGTLLGRPFMDMVGEQSRESAERFIKKVRESDQTVHRTEMQLMCGSLSPVNESRSPLPVEISAMAQFRTADRGLSPELQGIYGSARDLSRRKKVENDLQQISDRLNYVLDASPVVIYSRSHPDQRLTLISTNVMDLLGYDADELIENPDLLEEITHPDDRDIYRNAVEQLDNSDQVSCEYRLRHKEDGWRWNRDTVRLLREESGRPQELVGSWLDNTESHLLSEQLSYQASHDVLTGLPNRLAFEQRLNHMIKSAERCRIDHALCYLDLDQFKVINDTCGHIAGDTLLRQIGKILQSCIRRNDLLARLGGDEFGLLMENCTIENANHVAESLCQAVNEFRFCWLERSFQVGVSVGVVLIHEGCNNLEDVLSMADRACYAAKDAGRNRVHAYKHDDMEFVQRRGEMEWVSCINSAFEENRFCLAYQPIVRITNPERGGQRHYELLLRLRNKLGQLVMPGEFLPAAERYHLAWRLDHWVVQHAFDWLLQHPKHLSALRLCSINLSGHSLGDERLLGMLEGQLRENRELAGKICFEITETAAIANIKNAVRFIDILRGLSVRFALDDFGSGLSSFAYLKQLPVDFLKIDGAFVRGIAKDPVSLAMVRSINDIGQVMGMETIAEFVDDRETLDTLRNIGVNYAQGYWISKPRGIESLLN